MIKYMLTYIFSNGFSLRLSLSAVSLAASANLKASYELSCKKPLSALLKRQQTRQTDEFCSLMLVFISIKPQVNVRTSCFNYHI